MRLAISTGGGDAPGLNAVIRAIVLSAHQRGWESFGIRRGYDGLYPANSALVPAIPTPAFPADRRSGSNGGGLIPLSLDTVRGITHLGGTILGTTNRGNPFRWPARQADGTVVEVDRSDELVSAFRAHGFDALIAIGGDGSLSIAHRLWQKGIPVVGVPKTIDNDVWGTESTFGFDTAVATATDAIDKVHSTAESHDRVMVVELMGRNAGWITLHSGLSGSADVILIPEIPFSIAKVCAKIREREARGRLFSIVAVAEGARPQDGVPVLQEAAGAGTVDRLGGIGAVVAQAIAEQTGKETRSLVLGHLQRGGSPTTFDRLLGLRFGSHAVRTVAEGHFGHCVVYQPPIVDHIPLDTIVGKTKLVPLDSGIILTARNLGMSLGD
jgi:6-phosphofructokinase 1